MTSKDKSIQNCCALPEINVIASESNAHIFYSLFYTNPSELMSVSVSLHTLISSMSLIRLLSLLWARIVVGCFILPLLGDRTPVLTFAMIRSTTSFHIRIFRIVQAGEQNRWCWNITRLIICRKSTTAMSLLFCCAFCRVLFG